jgi:glutamate formiminotransferase
LKTVVLVRSGYFSEGRRTEVIEALVRPFRETKGGYLFDFRADEDHNRLVVSLAGEPAAICDAVLAASATAVERIDLNVHRGAHPRMAAVDVIPFTPIAVITMEESASPRRASRAFSQDPARPVYYYEEARSARTGQGLR